MKITKDQLLNFLTDLSIAYELPPLIEKVEEVIEALQNNELEIEGYEHVKWTKFDPGKRVTYPPKGEEVLAWGLPSPDDSEVPTLFVCWRSCLGFSCEASAYPEIHFWRPLPPPPGKEEAGK